MENEIVVVIREWELSTHNATEKLFALDTIRIVIAIASSQGAL